jgi:hypothetical protein
LYRGLSPPKLFGDFWTFFRVVTGKEPMLFRSSLSAPRVTIFLLAHFLIVQTSRADSFNQIAEESRHLAEAGKSAEAIKLAEQTLPLAKSGNSPRALYSAQLTLAKLYLDKGETAEARKLAEQSRAGAEAFGDPGGAGEAEDFLRKHGAVRE